MRLIADMHISPATVAFLLSIGHDVIRVNNALSASAPDKDIVAWAAHNNRAILTQDLDFSTLVALSGKTSPSVISLRLSSSRIDYVNAILAKILPSLASPATLSAGAAIPGRANKGKSIKCKGSNVLG